MANTDLLIERLYNLLEDEHDPDLKALMRAASTFKAPKKDAQHLTWITSKRRKTIKSAPLKHNPMLLMASTRYANSFDPQLHHRPWSAVLDAHSANPWAPWLALCISALWTSPQWRALYSAELCQRFGKKMVPAGVKAINQKLWPEPGALAGAMVDAELLDEGVLFGWVEKMPTEVRLHAQRGLANLGASVRPRVLSLLKGRRQAQRLAGASIVEQAPDEAFVEPLTAAMGVEKVDKVRGALERALEACQPSGIPGLRAHVKAPEVYMPEQDRDIRAVMDALRSLLYESEARGSMQTWVALCNLVARARRLGDAELAADYALGHGVAGWNPNIRPAPWGWADDPVLAPLCGEPGEGVWTPVDGVLVEQEALAWFEVASVGVQGRCKTLLLESADMTVFSQQLRRAWGACARHDLPLMGLELRVDGGIGIQKCTVLRTFHRYGVQLARDYTFFEDGGGVDGRTSIRRFRVKVPKGHPLRASIPWLWRRQYLPLNDPRFAGILQG